MGNRDKTLWEFVGIGLMENALMQLIAERKHFDRQNVFRLLILLELKEQFTQKYTLAFFYTPILKL